MQVSDGLAAADGTGGGREGEGITWVDIYYGRTATEKRG